VSIANRDMIEVRLVFEDGFQTSRFWTADMVMRQNKGPDEALKSPPAFLREPRRTWAHPQDPLIFSALVDDADRDAALAWLDHLGGENRDEGGSAA
jgi:hypothetical protein